MIFFVNTLPKQPREWLREMTLLLKARNHQAFMRARGELLDAYEGDNLEALTQGYFKNSAGVVQSSVPNASQNIIDRAIRRLALVYKHEPSYGVTGWPEGYHPTRRWLFLKGAERLANLIGTLIIRPVVRDGELDYDLIWDYLPLFDADPLRPSAVLYQVAAPSADLSRGGELEWILWSREHHAVLDANGNPKPDPSNPGHVNPLKGGELPFVTVNMRPGREYWRWGYGKSLLDANIAINVALTEMRLGVRYSMMGQWVATGVNDDTKIVKGVDQTIKLPAGATLEALSPPAKMSEAVAYIRAELENALQNIGMSVQFGDSADQPSGESLKVKNIELLERREDDLALWRQVDNELYAKEKLVWEAAGLTGELPQRRVNFSEIEFPVPPREERARRDWELDRGLTAITDLLMARNPDGFGSAEEALTQIRSNLAVNRVAESS